MDNKLQKIGNDFIESMGELGSNFGINRMIGEIYSLLYISDEPLSLDFMTRKLKVSKGTISTNVRVLENWGALR